MKELLTEWRKETTKGNSTKRNKVISENSHESYDEQWYNAMDALVEMAHNKGHVTIACAQKALQNTYGFKADDVEYAIKLVAAAIGDGVLGAMPHPKHPEVTVYVPRD
tara:strand:- start:57 stop:380 length:324 start_codon:yes stop_codon:yes gene_type:complete